MFIRNIDKRIKILFLLMIILLILVIIKICYIELFEYSKLNTLAQDFWSRNL